MTPREILLKMLEWIAKEQEKAAKPGSEPFMYTSLRYCASQVAGGESIEEVMQLLQQATKAEPPYMQFDAMGPFRAIFLINRALATAA